MFNFRFMSFGVHPNGRKNTGGAVPKRIRDFAQVRIPCNMQIGPAATPIVVKGDHVYMGQVIARGDNPMVVPVHATVSGEVTAVGKEMQLTGKMADVITIQNDGKDELSPELQKPRITDRSSFLAAVRACGLVGLGGAGFPTHIKLDSKKKIDTLLINGMECEPYLTVDDYRMQHDADYVLKGAMAVMHWLDIPQLIVGIELNKPEAIAAMTAVLNKAAKEDADKSKSYSVQSVKVRYPQGAERTLIKTLTGRQVPEGGLPLDVGCIVLNVNTAAKLGHYLEDGEPVMERNITLDGSAIANPGNYRVPIGATVGDIIEKTGGFRAEADKVMMGGPMMGLALSTLDTPLLKMNNGIIALAADDAELPEEGPCIRCARCAYVCPEGLLPTKIDAAARKKDLGALKLFKANKCVECGCCTYICPARRYLVQNIVQGKALLRAEKAAQAAASAARKEA